LITAEDICKSLQAKHVKPSEEELRHLPFKNAFIYPRVSSPAQVKESHESMHEIAELLKLAKEDGYQSSVTPEDVEEQVYNTQKGNAYKEVLSEGEITIDFRDLGLSGQKSCDDRLALKHLQDSISEGETGAVYCSEAPRLTRDQKKITPYTLLDLMKEHSCRVRTPEYIKNPRIPRDWDDLADDLMQGIEELKVMSGRLTRKRRQKANRGEYVGGPVPPGFIVEIKEKEPSGRNIYGKYRPYPPHAEICEKMLQALVKCNFSKMKAYAALDVRIFPPFPPALQYMERLSGLRKAERVDNVGYRITPSMITSLAKTPELIGIWTWGDIVKPANHEPAVSVELWLEAHEGINNRGKPRGRSIHHEPLEWSNLLWFDNDGLLEKVSYHSVKGGYRIQREYSQGLGPSVFNISARYLDIPLTNTVLRQIEFSPFAEEVLMQLETSASHSNLKLEELNKEIARLGHRLENLEGKLGWEDGKHDEVLLKQIEKTQSDIDNLQSQPIPKQITIEISYKVVRDFLIGLPKKWYDYSRTLRNRLLKRLIDRVVLYQKGQTINATLYWKTGQSQTIEILRPRAKGYHESRWERVELDILKREWLTGSRDKIVGELPGRSWKAISHQAANLGLRRTPAFSNHTSQRLWEVDEDEKVRQLYETGVPITDISSRVSRSETSVRQRISTKGWKRAQPDERMAVTEFSNTNQSPKVSKRISCGIVLGGQVTSSKGSKQ